MPPYAPLDTDAFAFDDERMHVGHMTHWRTEAVDKSR
ncbi:hypothetical protein AWB77_05368 [Caballeronia fortuita]|uniref:Uncharacterized protein n=1 Tax=Caballeronia fortuita TaxID=1777138 RepID=A0A158DI66_9BURK|nr:hypothetical protein AWB77_05368 [Caballeronia fortuita]